MGRKNQQERKSASPNPEVAGDPQDRVRERAHQIFTERCRTQAPGDEVSDWLQAERELRGGVSPEESERPRPAQAEGMVE
jgi:hypothetical protein